MEKDLLYCIVPAISGVKWPKLDDRFQQKFEGFDKASNDRESLTVFSNFKAISDEI
jgi:hypothetical protein